MRQMLSSATLQAVSMSKRTSTMMYQISLQVQTQIFLRLCQEKCASYFSNLHTLFYKLQSAVLLLLEGLLFTQNFMGSLISISATVNLHGGCFDGYILKKMLTATEISSVFVTASYICFPTNISVLQQNKRQLNSLPLVILIYSVFSGYPNY